jgi:hypothetical protein
MKTLALREALLHVDDVVFADVEPLRQQAGLDLEALALEGALLLVEAEEELALRARGAEPHDAKVVEDVLEDVRADPVRRVRGELDALVGVVALHRLQQAHVSVLDQVEDVRPCAPVLHGDLHHEPQIGEHQEARRLHVALLDPAHRQLVLVFTGDRRVLAELRHVGGEGIGAPDRAVRGLRGRNGQCRPGREGLRVSRGVGHGERLSVAAGAWWSAVHPAVLRSARPSAARSLSRFEPRGSVRRPSSRRRRTSPLR